MAVALEPSFLDNQDLVALVDGREHAADTDALDEVGVADGHALHGQRGRSRQLGRGHVVDNHIGERVLASALPSLGSRRAKPFMALA